MNALTRGIALLACVILVAGPSAAVAQTPTDSTPTPPKSVFSKDRLFLNTFEFDGEIVDGQWWEGNLAYTDFDQYSAFTLELLGAVQPFPKFEVGGRVGFGATDTQRGLPDGSGATDFDVWGKYRIGVSSPDTDISIGGEMRIPTGDDRAGLGSDSFAATFFGALRQELQNSVFTAYAGIQFNEDGRIFDDVDLNGKTAGLMGGGVILPLTTNISFVGEANLSTERFEGTDSEFDIQGGINWHVTQNGVFRAFLLIGITDGGPDYALSAGYAQTF